MYISFALGILNEKNITGIMVLPIITLVSCILIGVVVSACSSRAVLKNVREFIEATDKLSRGDFSARLNIRKPPEFRILSKNFNTMAEELGSIEVLRTDFINNFSHEFKTPLNIILASLQVINHNIFNKNIKFSKDFNLKKYTNSIKQNSYRLLRLANNLIDITKIDSGYYEIQPKNCNIVSIIEDITISVAQYMKDKGIDLIFDTSFEEIIISCDPDKIERIMLNLLSNAVKYTKSPGIINVFIDKTEDTVIISVKDTGIGIPKENISIIFERFIQVDDTLTRKCEGSGIGLSLVQSLVQMHGGKIAVYSTKDIGSEFTFTLPLQTINNSDIIYNINEDSHSKLDKCNIEFSDIYSLY